MYRCHCFSLLHTRVSDPKNFRLSNLSGPCHHHSHGGAANHDRGFRQKGPCPPHWRGGESVKTLDISTTVLQPLKQHHAKLESETQKRCEPSLTDCKFLQVKQCQHSQKSHDSSQLPNSPTACCRILIPFPSVGASYLSPWTMSEL
jgi:hypothetical protein